MGWPFDGPFAPLRDGLSVEVEGRPFRLSVVDCGLLHVPTGRLAACDPFVSLDGANIEVAIPPGTWPVMATLADVSEEQDGSHIREAYLSVVVGEGSEAKHSVFSPPGAAAVAPDQFYGFAVDSGTCCFYDAGVIHRCMPDPKTWSDELFEAGRPDDWFSRMDDPDEIRDGIANIRLPLATEGENIVICHSGWGDGFYPLQVSLDADDRLLALHIDLHVVAG